MWPVKGKVIRYFTNNNGIDIQTQPGEHVKATREGRVVFADYLNGYGQTIILDHSDGFHSVYAKNAELLVKLGDRVKKNAEISQVGISTNSSSYLHFEIRKNLNADNPLYYLP